MGDQGKQDEVAHSDTLAAGESDTLAGGPPRSPNTLAPGSRLGARYRLIRLLGEGGMGAVYLADDEVLGKQVALKFVHTASGPLRDEVLLAQKVTHRNVCRTYDLEEVGDRQLVKMEYVAGETLAERLGRDKRLPIKDALSIARAIAEGLTAAHAEGVVHRDLKPRNVMIEEGTGRVVLMDFGVARTTTQTGNTADDGISGTPEYMAPEQVRATQIDGRADLYSLGCMLYELLVGEIPFPADTPMARALRQVEDAPRDPSRRRSDIPPWLTQLVLDLMKKSARDRPANARAVLTRLEGPQRRSRRVVLAVGLMLAAAAVGGLTNLRQPKKDWRPIVRSLPNEFEENTSSPEISPDGKQLAFISDRMDRENSRWNMFIEDLESGRARLVPTPTAPRTLRWTRDGQALLYRDFERSDAYRVSLADGKAERVGELIHSLDDCGDGRIAILRTDMSIGILEASHGERKILPSQSGVQMAELRCDRQGRNLSYRLDPQPPHVATDAPYEVWVAPVDGGAPRKVVERTVGVWEPRFSADGSSILYSALQGDRRNLFEAPLAGGKPRQITFGEGPDFAPTPSGDGRSLIYDLDTTTDTILALPTAGGRPRRITNRLDSLAHPVLSADGREVIVQSTSQGRTKVAVYPLGGGAPRVLAEGTLPRPTVDGREVLFVRAAEGRGRIMAVPFAGGPERVVAQIEGIVGWVGHLWDGMVYAMVLRAADQGVVVKVPLGGGVPVPARVGDDLSVLEFADGWRLVAGEKQQRIMKPKAALDAPPTKTLNPTRFSWSANGKFLLYVENGELHRYTLANGQDQLIGGGNLRQDATLSDDGETVYYAAPAGIVRRMMITNFADRPR